MKVPGGAQVYFKEGKYDHSDMECNVNFKEYDWAGKKFIPYPDYMACDLPEIKPELRLMFVAPQDYS